MVDRTTKKGQAARRDRLERNSTADIARMQSSMLKLLRQSPCDPISYAGLAYCSRDRCGRVGCSEACMFAAARRRSRQIKAIRRLFHNHGGPFYKVSIIHKAWREPFGNLRNLGVAAAMAMARRALDRLNNPQALAVGTLQVMPKYAESKWEYRIVLILAGGAEDNVRDALIRFGKGTDAKIKKTPDVDVTINAVLNCDIKRWQHTFIEHILDDKPQPLERCEFYQWLLTLEIGDRLFRYGCDRLFNRVPRRLPPKPPRVRKKRPTPRHLEMYQFQNRQYADPSSDPTSPFYVPTAHARPAPANYYDDE